MYVYIGSLGLLCYDFAGREVWRRRLATPKTMFGSGTSPVVAGDVVLLNRDDSTRPLLLAIDRHTGATAWESSEDDGAENQFRAAYATPVRWGSHWLVHPSGSVAAYSDQGELRWSLPTATGGASTPVVAADALVVGAWTNLGESDLRIEIPDFPSYLSAHDENGDGAIAPDEILPDHKIAQRPESEGGDIPLAWMFGGWDSDESGSLNAAEWQAGRSSVVGWSKDHGLLALRNSGDRAHDLPEIAWSENKSVAEVPSPVYFDGLVYMVKNGGIVSCLKAESGRVLYRKRLGALGSYYASPVVAGNRLYAASEKGTVVVFDSGPSLNVLARNDLGETIYTTPAPVGDRLYVRTADHLFCLLIAKVNAPQLAERGKRARNGRADRAKPACRLHWRPHRWR